MKRNGFSPYPQAGAAVDAVVIGRNEGARLLACLASLQGQVRRIIYVDSGSQDGSPGAATAAGAELVVLETDRPFTAARARNAGLKRLAEGEGPQADFVLFLDGDCSLREGFLSAALEAFGREADLVVVCGRRRERFPQLSVYNRLCDREWNTPVGEALACGGDALMRLQPVLAIGGYREDLIAGEEPELCQRLRRVGGRIRRIDAEMTWHDAAMTRFAQFWRRSKRAGHAFAEGAALHGAGPDGHWRAETRRALFWGAVLPLASIGMGLISWPGFLLLLAFPLQMARLAWRWRAEGRAGAEAAIFTTIGKIPEAIGAIGFCLGRLRGKRPQLIEYK